MFFDCNLNFPKYLFGHLANAGSQRVHGFGGVEVEHRHKFLIRDIFGGVKAAAGQQRVGKAHRQGVGVGDIHIKLVVLLQVTALNAAYNVLPVVVEVDLREIACDLNQHFA